MGINIGFQDEDRQKMADYYNEGYSLNQTATHFNCSMRTVRYSLEKLNVQTRTTAEGYAALWKDPAYKENQRLQKLGKPSGATGKSWKLKTPPKRKRGEESPSWKGGITELTKAIRTAFEYLLWKKEILKRDNYTCVQCGANFYNDKKVILDVDHIIPFSQILEEQEISTLDQARICKELWDINNGRVLCRNCHKKTESYARTRRAINKKRDNLL